MKIRNIILSVIATSMLVACGDESMFNKVTTDSIKVNLEQGAMPGKDLLLAAVSGNAAPSIIKKVAKAKGVSLATEYNGRNLLYFATSPEMIKFLATEIPLNYVDEDEIPAMFTYNKPELAQTALDCLYEKFKANFASIKDKKEVQKKIIASFPQSMLDNAKNAEMIKFWLSFGINANTSLKISPLFVHIKDAKKIKVLLDNGANPNVKDNKGVLALLIALKQGNFDVAKLLLEKGADINAKDENGNSILQLIVYEVDEWEKTVAFLVENGADQNVTIKTIMNNGEIIKVPSIPSNLSADEKFVIKQMMKETPLAEFAYDSKYINLVKIMINKKMTQVAKNSLLKKIVCPKEVSLFDVLGGCIGSNVSLEERLKLAEFLLDNGANPNIEVVHNNRKQPLIECVESAFKDLLLKKGVK